MKISILNFFMIHSIIILDLFSFILKNDFLLSEILQRQICEYLSEVGKKYCWPREDGVFSSRLISSLASDEQKTLSSVKIAHVPPL